MNYKSFKDKCLTELQLEIFECLETLKKLIDSQEFSKSISVEDATIDCFPSRHTELMIKVHTNRLQSLRKLHMQVQCLT